MTQPLVELKLPEQKQIIKVKLTQAKERSAALVQQRIDETLSLLAKESLSLKEIIIITNQTLVSLEHIEGGDVALDFLKAQGLFKMLYHNPKVIGQELPKDDILVRLMRTGFLGVGVSVLLIGLFVAAGLLGAPLWLSAITTGLFVGASAYLSGMLYGVTNDIFATHANLPYFLLGHQPQQTSLLRTNDKVAQGIAWGVAATFGPVVIAAIVFSVAATITAFFVPMATFIMPLMMVAMPLIAVGAEFYARKRAKEHSAKIHRDLDEFSPDIHLAVDGGSYDYQSIGLEFMSSHIEDRSAWFATNDRNMFGFTRVPLIGLAVLVTLITLSAVSGFLPAFLFAAPLVAVIIPASVAGAGALMLGLGGLYTYINRNRMIDDRYKLDFKNKTVNYNLYVDDAVADVKHLLQHNPIQKANVIHKSEDQGHHFDPLFVSQSNTNRVEIIDEEELTSNQSMQLTVPGN